MTKPEERPPLCLLVQPDEYLCTWLLPGPDGGPSREHPGALHLRANLPPEGTVYGDLPIASTDIGNGQGKVGFPQEVTLEHLRARLANGHDVDLVDVTISYCPKGVFIRATLPPGSSG